MGDISLAALIGDVMSYLFRLRIARAIFDAADRISSSVTAACVVAALLGPALKTQPEGYFRFFVVSCGFGLIQQAPHRAADQVDHGDEIGLVTIASCP